MHPSSPGSTMRRRSGPHLGRQPMAAPVRTMRTMLSDAGAPQWTCTMAGARSTRMARNRAAAHAQVAVEVVAAVAHPTRGMGQTPCCTWLWRICRCQAGSNPHAEHIAQWSALWKAAAFANPRSRASASLACCARRWAALDRSSASRSARARASRRCCSSSAVYDELGGRPRLRPGTS
jgi:hypothetical protein